MPKEHKKRGRREEKKRKRHEEEDDYVEATKCQRFHDGEYGVEEVADHQEAIHGENPTTYDRPSSLPFYGLLDEGEQEYFKRADSLLELNQFDNEDDRSLFLANVYKEANGKELKIASSQSCSRLMERLILLSTSDQLKGLFEKFSGQFIHLFQHRFASHCCEALFMNAAPIVTQELIAAPEISDKDAEAGDINVSMESLFLYTVNELEADLGYLITDQFASHPLRLLLVILSGMPLTSMESRSLLRSRKKEHISIMSNTAPSSAESKGPRIVPSSFLRAVDKMIAGSIQGLDTYNLRALATHPIANPVLQLLLQIEFAVSRKQNVKTKQSLFRKLLPDNPLNEGTESVSFIKSLSYDPIGSRLVEMIVQHAPGKRFKMLYQSFFDGEIGTLAKNETAAFVVIKIIQRLSKEDLQNALEPICAHISTLVKRSRTAVIKTLIETCQTRQVEMQPIAAALGSAYGEEPSERLINMLQLSTLPSNSIAEDRRQRLETQDSAKVHGSLLAQCMLGAPGPLCDFIIEALIAMQTPVLTVMAKDRTASRVLQSALYCSQQTPKIGRTLIPRFYGHIEDLANDVVASHVIDAIWSATDQLMFVREKVADELAAHEQSLRSSISGRAVWRNWKMDVYKIRRKEWLSDAKSPEALGKTGIAFARERFVAKKDTSYRSHPKQNKQRGTGANRMPQGRFEVEGKA